MFFEWDDDKAQRNLEKHGVSFEEAQTVFDDESAGTKPDPDHSWGEEREIIVAHSEKGRPLLVSFTQRGDAIRIINSGRRPGPNANTMKKNAAPEVDDELRPEYPAEFFKNMKPNRFARMDYQFEDGTRRVLLDPDVAAEFVSSEAVNAVLRSAMRTAVGKK